MFLVFEKSFVKNMFEHFWTCLNTFVNISSESLCLRFKWIYLEWLVVLLLYCCCFCCCFCCCRWCVNEVTNTDGFQTSSWSNDTSIGQLQNHARHRNRKCKKYLADSELIIMIILSTIVAVPLQNCLNLDRSFISII